LALLPDGVQILFPLSRYRWQEHATNFPVYQFKDDGWPYFEKRPFPLISTAGRGWVLTGQQKRTGGSVCDFCSGL